MIYLGTLLSLGNTCHVEFDFAKRMLNITDLTRDLYHRKRYYLFSITFKQSGDAVPNMAIVFFCY